MSKNCIAVFDSKSSSNSGKISGYVSLHQCSLVASTKIRIKLSGFKPGTTHGIHIHEFGDLSEGCLSACSHYSIPGQLHGSISLFGKSRHIGDLCSNITADSTGKVDFVYQDELVNLSGPYSVVGRMIVIHDKPDDLGRYRYENNERGRESAKTGNAGKRIACAVIGLSRTDFCD